MVSSVEYFTKKIGDHFYREMEIAVEMLEADLTDEEWDEINEFMLNHPWHEIVDIFKSKRDELRELAE